jgi:hypothetical protein
LSYIPLEERLGKFAFCSFNTDTLAFRQVILFHSYLTFFKKKWVQDLFTANGNFTFCTIVFPSAYPRNYSGPLLLRQSLHPMACG